MEIARVRDICTNADLNDPHALDVFRQDSSALSVALLTPHLKGLWREKPDIYVALMGIKADTVGLRSLQDLAIVSATNITKSAAIRLYCGYAPIDPNPDHIAYSSPTGRKVAHLVGPMSAHQWLTMRSVLKSPQHVLSHPEVVDTYCDKVLASDP